jgi:hypothetical protein
LVKATSGSGIGVGVGLDRLVLGSIPDIGFKGDPAFHGPKRYDWSMLAGSIKYLLWRIQERVVGTGPDTPMGQNQWMPVGPPLPPDTGPIVIDGAQHAPPPPAPVGSSGQEQPR